MKYDNIQTVLLTLKQIRDQFDNIERWNRFYVEGNWFEELLRHSFFVNKFVIIFILYSLKSLKLIAKFTLS